MIKLSVAVIDIPALEAFLTVHCFSTCEFAVGLSVLFIIFSFWVDSTVVWKSKPDLVDARLMDVWNELHIGLRKHGSELAEHLRLPWLEDYAYTYTYMKMFDELHYPYKWPR